MDREKLEEEKMDYLPGFLPLGVKEKLHSYLKRRHKWLKDLLGLILVHRRARGIKISWEHPSPANPEFKGLLTRELQREWDFDGFWSDFTDVMMELTTLALGSAALVERVSGDKTANSVEFLVKTSPDAPKPSVLIRHTKATGLLETRLLDTAWNFRYQLHREPLRLEAWAECVNVPLYWHPAIIPERQAILDFLLRSINPELPAGSAKIREDYSPSRPWISCLVSDPLDAFAEFDVLWEKLLDMLRYPVGVNAKLQNVSTDGFTVFIKGSSNRSSWSWLKYRFDKYKTEDSPNVIGPAVETTVAEIVCEHYSAWRELLFRSFINVQQRPLHLEMWAETTTGVGPRVQDPLATIYFGLLMAFGKLYERRDKALLKGPGSSPQTAAGPGGSCCKRRTPASAPRAEDKDKAD